MASASEVELTSPAPTTTGGESSGAVGGAAAATAATAADGTNLGFAVPRHVGAVLRSFASPMERAKYVGSLFYVQLGALVPLRFRHYRRRPFQLAGRVLVTPTLLLLLLIIQNSTESGSGIKAVREMREVGAMPKCDSVADGECITLMFAPADDPDVYDVMSRVAEEQGLSISPFVESAEAYTLPDAREYDIIGTPWTFRYDMSVVGNCTGADSDWEACGENARCGDPDGVLYEGGCVADSWGDDACVVPGEVFTSEGGDCPPLSQLRCANNHVEQCGADYYCADAVSGACRPYECSLSGSGCPVGQACTDGDCVVPTVTADPTGCCEGDMAACEQACMLSVCSFDSSCCEADGPDYDVQRCNQIATSIAFSSDVPRCCTVAVDAGELLEPEEAIEQYLWQSPQPRTRAPTIQQVLLKRVLTQGLTVGVVLFREADNDNLPPAKWRPSIHFNETREPRIAKIADGGVVYDARMELHHSIARAVAARSGLDFDYTHSDRPDLSSTSEPDYVVNLVLPLMLWAGFFIHTISIMVKIVQEHVSGVGSMLRVAGMSEFSYATSLFVTELTVLTVHNLLTIMFGAMFQFRFFLDTNFFVLFFLLFTYSMTVIASALMMSILLKSTQSITLVALACFIIGIVMMMLFSFEVNGSYSVGTNRYGKSGDGKGGTEVFVKQFPPYNLAKVCADILFQTKHRLVEQLDASGDALVGGEITYERGPGFSWADFTRVVQDKEQLPHMKSASEYVSALVLDTFVQLLFTWYLVTVFLKHKPVYFFLLPSYWLVSDRAAGLKTELGDRHDVNDRRRLFNVASDMDPDLVSEHNAVREHMEERDTPLAILKMNKTYRKGWRLSTKHDHRALDAITFHGQHGTVLGLVGHNGAGKTTLIRILTGQELPTGGDALVHGFSCITQRDIVRQLVGVCGQHNAHFAGVSAREHLCVVAAMKGMHPDDVPAHVDQLLADVDLLDVQYRAADEFSGGMARRLSVAMALVGDPRVVFLDEPTTSLDPVHRKELWSIIQRMKADRLVVLTTHMLEEADVLADKMAVLALGRLRAVGTTLHLKNRFGAGYHLQVTAAHERVDAVKERIEVLLPNAHLDTQNVSHLTYTIPKATLTEMTSAFDWIEGQVRGEGGLVTDWTVSHTTMEEVFVRITVGDSLLFSGAITNDTNSPQEQLNVVIGNGDAPVGFVLVNEHNTLAQVRDMIVREFAAEQLPTLWNFMSNGVVVSARQEKRHKAFSFLPTITVVQQSAFVPHVQHTATAAATGAAGAELAAVRAELTELRGIVATLRNENAQLRDRMDELEGELGAKTRENTQLRLQLEGAVVGVSGMPHDDSSSESDHAE